MGVIIKNATLPVTLCLTVLRIGGFWAPEHISGPQKMLYSFYTVISFMFWLGTYLTIQIVDLFQIWGDLTLMTGSAFLLFTNLAQAVKVVNVLARRRRILDLVTDADNVLGGVESRDATDIVKSSNREAFILQMMDFTLTSITTIGWAASAEKGQLPLRAWYPYDTSVSPAYELTYIHQVGALLIVAYLNVAKDTLVSALIAQCRCQFRLVGLALRTLGKDLVAPRKYFLSSVEEQAVYAELKQCIRKHEAALKAARELQACFTEHVLAQFTVSTIIMCVTAYQLAMEFNNNNWVRIVSMVAYLLCMMLQVFLYCYQGHHLTEESSEISGAAYECPWYLCSTRFRRALLIVMLRSRRIVILTACGFTTVSIDCFTSIIKASYTFFTVLRQVEFKD